MKTERDTYLKGIWDERKRWEKKIKQKFIELKNEDIPILKKYGEKILNDLLEKGE